MAEDSTASDEADRGTIRSLGRGVFDRLIRPILVLRDSPHSLALGLALGLWVALTPTVGIQMPIVVVIGTVIGANRLAGIAMCWISNPITFVPMYYGYYLLGLVILGRDGKSYGQIEKEVSMTADLGNWELIKYFFDVFGAPLWIGSLVIATVLAVPCYPLARRFFERREARRLERDHREVTAIQGRPNVVKGEN